MDDKRLETFVDQLMSNDTLETPSSDFTNSVLEKLEVMPVTITYKPLIPKWVWGFIAFSFAAITVYALLFHQDSGSKLSEILDFSKLENSLTDFTFPKSLKYAMIGLTIMIAVQIPVLRSYFNRRVEF